eukprot:Skav201841  [mRNA]  locus=scaffold484:249041:251642:- [translate_table: standard]
MDALSRSLQAHEAYMAHLKKHFDLNKAKYGMRDVEMAPWLQRKRQRQFTLVAMVDGNVEGSVQPVTLQWADGREEAWDRSSKQRLDFGIPMDLQVTEVAQDSSPAFRLHFSDGHVGHFAPPLPAETMWSEELHNRKRSFWGTAEASSIQDDAGRVDLGFVALQMARLPERKQPIVHCTALDRSHAHAWSGHGFRHGHVGTS